MTNFKVFLAEKITLPSYHEVYDTHRKLSEKVPPLEDKHKNAIHIYKDDDTLELNDYLRTGKTRAASTTNIPKRQNISDRIKNIFGKKVETPVKHKYGTKEYFDNHTNNLKEVTKHPIGHSLTLFRGLKNNHSPQLMKSGTLFTDKGSTSTSLHPKIGFLFAQNRKNHRYIARIHMKPHDKGYYLDHNNAPYENEEEREVLIHPNTTFRITKRHTIAKGHTRTHYIDMEIHHQDD